MDTEELGRNEQDGPLAWFGAQPPPRTGPPGHDPTLPRSILRTPSSVSTTDDSHHAGVGGERDPCGGCSGADRGEGVSARAERRDGGEAGGGGIAAAGVGAAHVLTGPGRLEDGAWEEASSACPGMR